MSKTLKEIQTTFDFDASEDINSVNSQLSSKSSALFARPEGQVLSNTNLYVCGLPQVFRGDQLKELFSPFGAISETRVLNNTILAESKGVGFVHFLDSENAKNAVFAMNGKIPSGMKSPLIVKFARDLRKNGKKGRSVEDGQPVVEGGGSISIVCKYFQSGKCNRGNECNYSHIVEETIPKGMSNLIRSLNTWGVIGRARSPNTHGGLLPNWEAPKAFSNAAAFGLSAEYNAGKFGGPPGVAAHPTAAVPPSLNPQNWKPYSNEPTRSLPIDPKLQKSEPSSKAAMSYGVGGMSKTNLYISQFPREWRSENLEAIFSKYGEIDKIRILTPEHAERNRGVGFVHFKTAASAFAAMTATQNYTPKNGFKPIIVKFANQGTKPPRNVVVAPNICKFWLKGECARGELCCFRHESSESSFGPKPLFAPEKGYEGPLDTNGPLFKSLAGEESKSDGELDAPRQLFDMEESQRKRFETDFLVNLDRPFCRSAAEEGEESEEALRRLEERLARSFLQSLVQPKAMAACELCSDDSLCDNY